MHSIRIGASAARLPSGDVRPFGRARLGLAATVAILLSGLASAAQPVAQTTRMGEPVNVYAPGAKVYTPFSDGEIHPWPVQGRVWLMAGQPGEANVAVYVGDEGVIVVDTGVQAMAPKLLAQIQQLAQARGGAHKAIRFIVNTNGLADHIGGNEVIRNAGTRVVAGEELALQSRFGEGGAAVWAHQKVLDRLVEETAKGGPGAPTESLWPSDVEEQEVYNMFFNGEAVQLYHAANANTDGQLMVLFRESDVIAAGDVVNMTSYPTIDVERGGTIDGELVALNKLMDMAVPDDQVEGGTMIIPGHGRLIDLGDLARYTVMITTIRNRVQFYKNQGRSLDQVLALNPSSDYDDRWSAPSGPGSKREFITAIYRTLPAKGPVSFSMETITRVPATSTRADRR
jgi:cyclase